MASFEMNKIFFVLSPLQILIVNCFLNENDNVWLITTPSLKKLVKIKSNIILLDIPDIQDSIFFKLSFVFKYRFLKGVVPKGIIFDEVYIPSDINLPIQAICSKLSYKRLIVFEEGGTLLYFLSANNSSFKKSFLNFFRLLIGLEQRHNILSSKEIYKAFLFSPDNYKGKFDFPVLNINPMLLDFISKDDSVSIDEYIFEPDFIFLTQPLTQDGYCHNNMELFFLRAFLDEKKFNSVIIKLHPRDNKERYVTMFPDVLLVEDVNPYQLLHFKLNPKCIGSYFSSVLFSTPSLNKNFNRYALISFLENDGIKKAISLYEETFDDLIIC